MQMLVAGAGTNAEGTFTVPQGSVLVVVVTPYRDRD